MKLYDFDFTLPTELIAQEPTPKRDQSRIMILERSTGEITEDVFARLPSYLSEGDVLVLNNTWVIPARLQGKRESGGVIEILLLSKSFSKNNQQWEALLKPGRRIKPGVRLYLEGGATAKIITSLSEKKWLIEFDYAERFDKYMKSYGFAPLPPYIKRPRDTMPPHADKQRYQTIYACIPGSIAAPTAGLHFSDKVMHSLERKGILTAYITLHVGYGTFKPITEQNVEDHQMEKEFFEISREAADRINEARTVVAVGTTSTRAIESALDQNGLVQPMAGETELFVYPGYEFRRVNTLLTNFHLPKSSLFLLACAFAGRERMMAAYHHAIKSRFRFYSYGDCMLII
jgi:S-adenosylmethionine:tRNA ribosyltransferase-isomerase